MVGDAMTLLNQIQLSEDAQMAIAMLLISALFCLVIYVLSEE